MRSGRAAHYGSGGGGFGGATTPIGNLTGEGPSTQFGGAAEPACISTPTPTIQELVSRSSAQHPVYLYANRIGTIQGNQYRNPHIKDEDYNTGKGAVGQSGSGTVRNFAHERPVSQVQASMYKV